jgi:glycosyltransferase involved in cell wall biosynthesis
VRKILLLIPSLDYSGAGRQATLLAAQLPHDRFDLRVCVLEGEAPWVETLRRGGVAVDVLGWKRPFDLAPFLGLRRLLRTFQPDIVHSWGPPALRALTLVGGPRKAQVVASAALPPQRRPAWGDRLLLRRASWVAVYTPSEIVRCIEAGVAAERIVEVPPAVSAEFTPEPRAADREATAAVPAGLRLIVGVGPLAPHKGFRDAVWTLDTLHYLYDDVRLALIGRGPARTAALDLARSLRCGERVHFCGEVADVSPWLRRAEVVWAPVHSAAGACGVLEAMATARPVAAGRVPLLADLVQDETTGYLVEPGDKTALARQTRFLLDDAERRRRFGEAARQRAAAYTITRMIEAYAALYERMTAV